ncbi:hypothetical protein V5799_016543 [Amblyomma americanum]|uniref:Uncharacterized protein n=1 Tax=Amblyomma americanum TaxID=6943 RepID=A0AAQ4F4U5_AMBAM
MCLVRQPRVAHEQLRDLRSASHRGCRSQVYVGLLTRLLMAKSSWNSHTAGSCFELDMCDRTTACYPIATLKTSPVKHSITHHIVTSRPPVYLL